MNFIARHKRMARKLNDVFADRRISGFQLARETYNEMDNISIAVANEWVQALNAIDTYRKPVEYNSDGTVKAIEFPE